MRIDSLKLTNFRSHAKSEFTLNRVAIIRGSHGSGKSSIQKAIEFALTGRCDQTDARGAGAEELITLGAKQMAVELAAGGAVITRSRNRAGGQLIVTGNGKSLAGKGAETAIESNFGRPDVLGAVLNATRFCRMPEKDQKALLAAALASDPVEIEPRITSLLADIGGYGGDQTMHVLSAVECDRIHKGLFDERADRKRELKALGDLQEPEIPEGCPELEAVSQQINDLERSKDRLVRDRTAACQKVTDANAAKLAKYNADKKRLSDARATVEEFGSWCIETSAEVSRLQRQLRERTEVGKIDAQIADNKAFRAQLRQERTRLEKEPTECYACKRPFDKLPDNSARLAEIDTQAQKLDDELQKLQDTRQKLPNFEEIQTKLDRHQAASSKVVAAEAVIEDLKNLAEPTYEPAADLSQLDGDVADLTQRLANGREIERQVVRYEEQRKQYEQAKAKRTELDGTISKLEMVTEYFSDRGPIKAKLVGGKLPEFVARINEVLDRFGFFCDVSLEPYRLTVDVAGKKLAISQLSESEEFRFGIAFAVALAEATGVGLCVLDRADILLPTERARMLQAMLESELEQVFILSASEPVNEFAEIPETTFFELENVDGTTRIRAQHKCGEKELWYSETE